MRRKPLIESCLSQPLALLARDAPLKPNDRLAGWGIKANTRKIKQQAAKLGLDYWHLEDGFIGYVGHPAKGGQGCSLIADDLGIFYDARQPSRLEQLIGEPATASLLARAESLIADIVGLGITKYNCYSNHALPVAIKQSLNTDLRQTVLLVDQVAGDLSIAGAMASESDFVAMVAQAKADFPNARLLLRTHPDTRLGKKRGVLAKLNPAGVEVISEACHPHALIKQVDAVYTVSSQMGFEALLLGKPVCCFGMPFYAGWGLTSDVAPANIKLCNVRERRGAASLAQLVAATLIRYPKYCDPILKRRCEIEDVVALVARQYRPPPRWRCLYLVGFSLWKRAFMQRFCAHLAADIKFVSKPPKRLDVDDKILVWGAKYPELDDCIRVEDGFIRSSGLGSNLCRPSSLSIDGTGIYFDSRSDSGLEQLLNGRELDETELERAKALVATLKKRGVSKYNVGNNVPFEPPSTNKRLILVVGQVDGDASIVTGSAQVKSNEALLWAVRDARPDAHILYKPHPDVIAGNRAGEVSGDCRRACVNEQVLGLELTRLFPYLDEMHTMTSLSGFEALVHGVRVTTWGQPFYAGWGLTEDIHPPKRRGRQLDLETLVYKTLVDYPCYIDWDTGLWSSPEQLIEQIAQRGNTKLASATKIQRWLTKLKYVSQTLLGSN